MAIQLNNVVKHFGNIIALNDVSFHVNNGEVVGYVGLNGAGKTTTIRIVAGVLNPDSGDAIIDGYSVTKDKKIASKNLGWVPELPIFEHDVNAVDYFTYLAGYYGISSNDAKKIAKELFREVGLEGVENKKLQQYSLGMKKRFALAVSLISNPNNFVFDEVLSGLDPQGIAFFRDLTLKFKREGKAVLFSSHILSEVETIADKVIFIHKGKIIREMSIEDIRKYSPVESVKLVLDKIDEKVIRVLSDFGTVEIEGSYIVIHNFNGDTSKLIQKLVSEGYKVYEVNKTSGNLESIFFQIIGMRA
ncbi:MAG: ABC transporter ATP-binding protein [Thermoprotei archaeon]